MENCPKPDPEWWQASRKDHVATRAARRSLTRSRALWRCLRRRRCHVGLCLVFVPNLVATGALAIPSGANPLPAYIHTCAHNLLAYVCILYLFGARGVCRSQAVLRCKLLERQSSLGAFLRSDLQGSGKLQRPQQFSALAVALRFGCRVLFSQGRESQCILLRRGVVTAAACSYNCDAGFAGPPLEFAIAALPAVLDGQGAHGLPQNPRPCMFLGHPRCLGGKKPTP